MKPVDLETSAYAVRWVGPFGDGAVDIIRPSLLLERAKRALTHPASNYSGTDAGVFALALLSIAHGNLVIGWVCTCGAFNNVGGETRRCSSCNKPGPGLARGAS